MRESIMYGLPFCAEKQRIEAQGRESTKIVFDKNETVCFVGNITFSERRMKPENHPRSVDQQIRNRLKQATPFAMLNSNFYELVRSIRTLLRCWELANQYYSNTVAGCIMEQWNSNWWN